VVKNESWSKAKNFKIFGFHIPVLKVTEKGSPRKFYTELHDKDDAYLASMGSNMPTYLLAALETYIKRGKLL